MLHSLEASETFSLKVFLACRDEREVIFGRSLFSAVVYSQFLILENFQLQNRWDFCGRRNKTKKGIAVAGLQKLCIFLLTEQQQK